MSRKIRKSLVTMALSLITVCSMTFISFAAQVNGSLETVDAARIAGWIWCETKVDNLKAELRIYIDGASEAAVVAEADVSLAPSPDGGVQYAFEYAPDWYSMGGTSYRVEAYAVVGKEKTLLSGEKTYVSSIVPSVSGQEAAESTIPGENAGPGVPKVVKPEEPPKPKRGKSLGMFTTTGYCSCELCCGDNHLTYSGTVPQPDHTISADISVFPIGTKLMIDDVVYTVEDIGSGVNGRKLDIFYATHEEAWEHGTQSQEVFEVIEE